MIEQQNSIAEKFFKKGFWLYFFSFIVAPVWYIIKIILSNDLSVEEMWVLYGTISLITLLAWFNDFWMTESLKKFIPQFITEKKYEKVKSILIYTVLIQLITSIIIFLIFYFWATFIWNNYFDSKIAIEVIKIFSIYFILNNIFQVIQTFYIAIQNTFLSQLINFIRMIFLLLFVWTLFFTNNWNIEYYSYAWLFWLFISIIISYTLFYHKYYNRYLRWIETQINKDLFKKVLKYALMVFIWAQAWTILSQIDMQMIIYILWSKDAWYYTNYLSLMNIPIMIINPIFILLFPVFSELYAKWESNKINLVKNIFQKNFLSIWMAFNILLFVFWEIIAYIFFWEKFIQSWIILKYSIILLSFNFLLQINYNILAAIWKVKERAWIVFKAIWINFITNIIFINIIWVEWAALATWLWWIFIWIMSNKILWEKYKTQIDYKYIWKNILLLIIMWTLIYFNLPTHFIEISRINLFFLCLLVWIIYFTIFFAFNYKDFKYFFYEIKKIRKDKKTHI
jgi:O-antigen/teichoic acid export membrane protein